MSRRFMVLGVPRSGTSMVAGLYADANLFTGPDLLNPTVSNPRGYFESARINQLNNQLISEMVRWPKPLDRLRRRLDLRLNKDMRCFPFASPWRLGKATAPAVVDELAQLTRRPDFCFKDPRFCVTLPVWAQVTPEDTKFLVVFREPSKTIQSYLKNGLDVYDPPLIPCRRELSIAYARNYRRLMTWAKAGWLFVHYDQVLSPAGLARLSAWSGLRLRQESVDRALNRSSDVSRDGASADAWRVYESLCSRAGFGG